MLKRDSDPETVSHAGEVIERNVRVQNRLIDDLLDFTRIRSGKVALEMKPVQLVEVIDQLLEAMPPVAEKARIKLRLYHELPIGPVWGDTDRLQQVFRNLVENSIKFTPSGGSIEIRLERQDGHGVATVTDTGCGIPPALLPHFIHQ